MRHSSATPVSQAFVDEQAFAYDLARYDAVNRSLVAQGVRPGYVFEHGRLLIRGEFEDVPRRFLDLSDKREGYGNVDDRAGELGFEDGDELVSWMQTARRPVKRDYMIATRPKDRSRKRMRKARKGRDAGACLVVKGHRIEDERIARGLKTCAWCSYQASVRVARAREAAKAAACELVEDFDAIA